MGGREGENMNLRSYTPECAWPFWDGVPYSRVTLLIFTCTTQHLPSLAIVLLAF